MKIIIKWSTDKGVEFSTLLTHVDSVECEEGNIKVVKKTEQGFHCQYIMAELSPKFAVVPDDSTFGININVKAEMEEYMRDVQACG